MNFSEIASKVMMTMMIKTKRTVYESSEFKKSLRKARKQGKDLDLLNKLIKLLANDEVIPIKYKDHALKGKEADFRELHIQKDWMLVYKKTDKGELILILQRLGSHSEFGY